MADSVDDYVSKAREALTGWFRGKEQDSGKGGDDRAKTIDSSVDEAVNGPPKKNQSTDHQNGYN